MTSSASLSSLALASVKGRAPQEIPRGTYLMPYGPVREEAVAQWVDVVTHTKGGLTPTSYNNLNMNLPAYNYLPSKKPDTGLFETSVAVGDSWRTNCLLSNLPSHLRLIDKTLTTSSHFPVAGNVHLTPLQPVSLQRAEAIRSAIENASDAERYLLFDANLPRSSAEGYRMPKAWLWDIYDYIGLQLDRDAVTDDPDTYNPKSCIYIGNGKITYGKNGEGLAYDTDGSLVDLETSSTKVTDEFTRALNALLQDAYNQGICRGSEPPSTHPRFTQIGEDLWRPSEPLYPSAVELYYN